MIDKLLITCLQRNKRLVIPTLGAFIRKSIDGVGIVLVFVPFLNKDDGVLLNAFKEWAGVDSNDANQMLEEYVSHIKSTLDKRGEYVIEGIGVLRYDANGSLYLAKEGSVKKEETEKEELKQTMSPNEEVKPSEIKQQTPEVVIEKPRIIEPAQEIIAPAQIMSAQQPVEDFNSRFAPQQPQQPQFQPTEQSTLNDIKPISQPQYSSPQKEETEQQQPYRKVVTGSENFQPQRRQANVGAVYFTGDDGGAAKQQETTQNINVPQQLQNQQSEQQQSQQQQQQQQRPMTGQERTNALYGTNRRQNMPQQPAAQRVIQPQPMTNQTAGVPQQRRPMGARPQQKSNANKMSASAKLIWILAIVAIVLTIFVIIYAVVYGDEVPLNDEIQIEQTMTPQTSDIQVEEVTE